MFHRICRKLYITLLLLSLLLSGCRIDGSVERTVSEPEFYPQASVAFSHGSGIYPDGLDLTLSSSEGYDIFFTMDGSLPGPGSQKYVKPITLTGSAEGWLDEETVKRITVEGVNRLLTSYEIPDAWTVRAVAVAPDGTSGPVSTCSYITSEDHIHDSDISLIVFITCDPDSLLDYDTGILAKGRCFDDWYSDPENRKLLSDSDSFWKIEANYTQKGKEWEKTACVEILDLREGSYTCHDGGIRIQGRSSRKFSHKSFNIYFRNRYGSDDLAYDLFLDGITYYDSFTLRNGGNSADGLVFKDSLQQSLLSDMSFLTQRTRTATLYLNGEYWGSYCLNERYTSEQLENRLGTRNVLIVKEDEYEDGLERYMYLYEELTSFASMDMNDPDIWESFKQIVDVDEMAEYFAAQVYMANCDLSYFENCELFICPRPEYSSDYDDGRWHFILFDTELSSGLYDDPKTAYNSDTLSELIGKFPLFASALKSKEFRDLFTEAIKEIGCNELSYESVCDAVDLFESEWNTLLPLQYARFGDDSDLYTYHLSLMKEFYRKRYDYIVPTVEKILAGY